MASSRNEGIVRSLTSALQPTNGSSPSFQKDSNLYNLISKINDDLYSVYNSLFTGPLPAVSGENLTNLNASAITSGTVPLANLPTGIAFLANANTFTNSPQLIQFDKGEYRVSMAAGTEFGHFQIDADGDVIISCNLFWNGAWSTDAGTLGSGMRFFSGEIQFAGYNSGFVQRGIIDSSGIWQIGGPASASGLTAGEMVFANNKNLWGNNQAGSGSLQMIGVDVNNLVSLGTSADSSGNGHISIPRLSNASLPAAGATRNGILVIDKDNNRLCYYVSGNRYYLTGTSF